MLLRGHLAALRQLTYVAPLLAVRANAAASSLPDGSASAAYRLQSTYVQVGMSSQQSP